MGEYQYFYECDNCTKVFDRPSALIIVMVGSLVPYYSGKITDHPWGYRRKALCRNCYGVWSGVKNGFNHAV